MADEDEVVVEIETPVAEAGEEVKIEKEGQQSSAVDELKKQFEELQTSAAQEKAAREAAEARAREAAAIADQARKQTAEAVQRAHVSETDTIETALEAANNDATAAKRDIRLAIESGDLDSQTDAIDRLTSARATIMQLEEAKSHLAARAKEAPKVEKIAPSDPVEAYIGNRTAPTQAWLRKHTDYITDQRKNAKLTAAHYDAVGEGIAVDTPEYFDRVEQFLGLKEVEKPGEVKTPAKRPAAPPVSPGASGGGSRVSGAVPATVKLTPAEARSATDGTIVWNYDDPKKGAKKGEPIGVQEFARRKLQLQQQGAYDRAYVES